MKYFAVQQKNNHPLWLQGISPSLLPRWGVGLGSAHFFEEEKDAERAASQFEGRVRKVKIRLVKVQNG